MGSYIAQSVFVAIVIAVSAHTGSAEKVPYLVSLEKNGYFFCYAVILDDKTIIAAAHCVLDTKGYLLKSYMGFTVKASNKTRQVEQVIHYQDPSKTGYDLNGANIVIIKLKESLGIDNDPDLARVNLPNVLSRDNYEDKILTLNINKTYKMRIVTNETCIDTQTNVKNGLICAYFVDSQISYDTQSIGKGPLLFDNTLLGLHYDYHHITNDTYRFVGFINISAHLGFIINAIQENYTCNMRVLKL